MERRIGFQIAFMPTTRDVPKELELSATTASHKVLNFVNNRHTPHEVPNVEFDFYVWFLTLMQNLMSKMDKLGSRRRPTLS